MKPFPSVALCKVCTFILGFLACLLLAACTYQKDGITTQAHIVDKLKGYGFGQQLAWSPDGKSLSFVEGDPQSERGQLVVLDLLTRKLQKLGGHEWNYDAANRWAPDGTQIVVAKGGEIWLMRVADGHATYLAHGEDAAWSADSKLLAVLRGARTTELPGYYQIAFVTPEGKEQNTLSVGTIPTPVPAPTPLPTEPGYQGIIPWNMSLETHLVGIDWSPDAHSLAYAIYFPDEDRTDLYLIGLDDTKPRRFNTSGFSMEPAWSPQGDKIAYVHSLDDVTWDLFVASADGKCQIRLTQGGYVRDPAWSPDGSKIAVLESTSDNIYILDVEKFLTDQYFDPKQCKQ